MKPPRLGQAAARTFVHPRLASTDVHHQTPGQAAVVYRERYTSAIGTTDVKIWI